MIQKEAFFDEQTGASKLKADIVSKYFSGWANVMASQDAEKIAYLDLFSGPGRYEDGNLSTPLLVIEKTLTHFNPKVCKKVALTFNDADPDNIEKLERELTNYPGIEKLKYQPATFNLEVDEDIVKGFENTAQVPTLSFVDPWGYKGLSLPLIKALVKDWGCDCIFFFNYRRINPGIENPALEKPISLLFTEDVLNDLRGEIRDKEPHLREKIILRKVGEVFKEWGMEFVLPFPFKNERGTRTIHYLIFVTKHVLGHDIMKEIMGRASSYHPQGVPSFEYNPAAAKTAQYQLFELEKPLDELKEMLLDDFAGMTLTMQEIFDNHHVGRRYVEKNYRKALLELETENRIKTNRVKRKARKGTFPGDMVVKFGPKTRR